MTIVAAPLLALLASTLFIAPPRATESPCDPNASEEMTPRSEAEEAQISPEELEARIAVCEAKRNAPLGPLEPAPRADSMHSSRHKGRIVWPTILHRPTQSGWGKLRLSFVILEAIVDSDGCVRQPKLIRTSNRQSRAAALDALRHFVFHPATLDAKPVTVHYVLTFNFD